MTELYWLMAASAIIWLGLGAFTAFLACRQKELRHRLESLEHGDD